LNDNTKTLDQLSGPLMKNKKGLIMGVANNHSLAWGIAKKFE
jgi:enoyl-[acyl-carrier-protein] reductase (NADH)